VRRTEAGSIRHKLVTIFSGEKVERDSCNALKRVTSPVRSRIKGRIYAVRVRKDKFQSLARRRLTVPGKGQLTYYTELQKGFDMV
jgi:hypothetical protein